MQSDGIGRALVPAHGRNCGDRDEGGLYAESGQSEFGLPLEDFMPDAFPIDAAALGLTAVGVQILPDPRTGLYHVWDIVGREFYPNAADVVEEIRRYGMSRRLPKTADVSLLTPGSLHFLLHARAWVPVEDWQVYEAHFVPVPIESARTPGKVYQPCPTVYRESKPVLHHALADHPNMCIGVWWNDVAIGDRFGGELLDERRVKRTLPSFSYTAVVRPTVTRLDPQYQFGVVLAMPITRLVVVRARDGSAEELAERVAGKTTIPVELEDR